MTEFWLCFVPLFVAVDALGVLPLFLGLTTGMDVRDVRRIIRESVATAAVIALAFAAAGPHLLRLLGITVPDFMAAGGALLLALAVRDLVFDKEPQHRGGVISIGAVPLGVPLITGPAVLTTSILLVNQYGIALTGAALVANVLFAGFVFRWGARVNRFLGSAGSVIASKIANLLLAAIGVMMIRKGIEALLAANPG